MYVELTELEKNVLAAMFKMFDELLVAYGMRDWDADKDFTRNDLFNLAEKLGVEEY